MKNKLNLNVLYVEDEETIRECMGGFLKRRFNDVFLRQMVKKDWQSLKN